jgi:hypothetical protein
MEREASMDFGTGLLAQIRRNPAWRADRRELVRVAYVQMAPEPQGRRASLLSLVPIAAAIIAELAT